MEWQIAKCWYPSFWQVTGIPAVFVSALEGRGRIAVMRQVIDTYEKWCLRLSTSRLNRWLRKVNILLTEILFGLFACVFCRNTVIWIDNKNLDLIPQKFNLDCVDPDELPIWQESGTCISEKWNDLGDPLKHSVGSSSRLGIFQYPFIIIILYITTPTTWFILTAWCSKLLTTLASEAIVAFISTITSNTLWLCSRLWADIPGKIQLLSQKSSTSLKWRHDHQHLLPSWVGRLSFLIQILGSWQSPSRKISTSGEYRYGSYNVLFQEKLMLSATTQGTLALGLSGWKQTNGQRYLTQPCHRGWAPVSAA